MASDVLNLHAASLKINRKGKALFLTSILFASSICLAIKNRQRSFSKANRILKQAEQRPFSKDYAADLPLPLKSAYFHIPPTDEFGNYDEEFYDDNDTVFGGILRGQVPAVILLESNNLLAFQDIRRPAAPLHGLVIPKRLIKSVLDLTPDDLSILYEMKTMSRQLIDQYYPDMENREFRLAFHIPPFIAFEHLHLHVLAPLSKMSWFSKTVWYPVLNTRWTIHLDQLIDRLEQDKKPVAYRFQSFICNQFSK